MYVSHRPQAVDAVVLPGVQADVPALADEGARAARGHVEVGRHRVGADRPAGDVAVRGHGAHRTLWVFFGGGGEKLLMSIH